MQWIVDALSAIVDFISSGATLIFRVFTAIYDFVVSFPGRISVLIATAAYMPAWIWIPLAAGSTALVIVMIVRIKQVIV